MKLILFILFLFILFSTVGQTITVKEYDQNGDPIAVPNSERNIVPGDTISLEISILETAIDDFRNTPPLPRESFAWVYTASNYTEYNINELQHS